MADEKKSPFAELSFSEQQEQWRLFRSQSLDFRQLAASKPAAPAPRTPAPVYPAFAPQHQNLDRVRAQLSQAVRQAGAFQPLTSRE